MKFPNLPGRGGSILIWATQAQACLRELDRRLNSIVFPRPAQPQPSPSPQKPKPFEMSVVEVEGVKKIRVRASTLAGGSSEDIGFSEGDAEPYLLTLASGVLQGGITLSEAGAITDRWLEIADTLKPIDIEERTYYIEIGTIGIEDTNVTVNNSRYGPIDAAICRNWFSNPPVYDVHWNFIREEI